MFQFFIAVSDSLVSSTIRFGARATLTIPGVLATRINTDCPPTMIETFDGLLFFANGINPMLKWDGIGDEAVPVGCPAPQTPIRLENGGDVSAGGSDTEMLTFQFSETLINQGGAPGTGRMQYRATVRNESGTELAVSSQIRTGIFEAFRTRFVDEAAARVFFFGVVDPQYQSDFILWQNAYGRARQRAIGGFLSGGRTPAQLAAEIRRLSGIPPNHYLTTPSSQFTLECYRMPAGATPVAGITGSYVAYQRFIDNYGNPSDPSPPSNLLSITAATFNVSYQEVEVPTDSRVVLRQIWRNTDGQMQLFYKDVETQDLQATSFVSSQTDSQLELSHPVAFFNSDLQSLVHNYGLPPSWKHSIASLSNYLFAAGDRAYTKGCVSVTNGSASVTGLGTDWPSGYSFAGRFLFVNGSPAGIEILDITGQTILLASPYNGVTDPYATYAIKPPDAERNALYFTFFGSPEAWPYTNSWSLEEDGDEITGLTTHRGDLYVLKQNHIYRFSFVGTPLNADISPPASRGCVSSRVAVQDGSTLYCMDYDGIYALSPGGETQSISDAIGDLFRKDGEGYRVNWNSACHFHATTHERVIRWFVALSGTRYPRHALCFRIDTGSWWIEEYPFAVSSSCLARLGKLRPVVGGSRGKTYVMGEGTLDLTDPTLGATRGTVTAAGKHYVTTAMDLAAVAAGQPILIVNGRGKGQIRTIAAAANGEITVKEPWSIKPSGSGQDQSVFQIGGIPFLWRSGLFNFAEKDDKSQSRDMELHFLPKTDASTFDVRLRLDGSNEPLEMSQDRNHDNWKVYKDRPDIEVEWGTGYAGAIADGKSIADAKRLQTGCALMGRDFFSHRGIPAQDCMELELSGGSSAEKTKFYRIILQGVEGGS